MNTGTGNKSQITFEWLIEIVDGDPADADSEIIDCFHQDNLAQHAGHFIHAALAGIGARLALVRETGNQLDGITDRSWAYVTKGKLPERFDWCGGELNGPKVPKKYADELALIAQSYLAES